MDEVVTSQTQLGKGGLRIATLRGFGQHKYQSWGWQCGGLGGITLTPLIKFELGGYLHQTTAYNVIRKSNLQHIYIFLQCSFISEV